jgi:hypothetical protein
MMDGWIHLWYVVRISISVTMYPQYNNNKIIFEKQIHKAIPFTTATFTHTKYKWDHKCGSSSTVPAWQTWSPEFKSQHHKKGINLSDSILEVQWKLQNSDKNWRGKITHNNW